MYAVVLLVEVLHRVGAHDQLTALLARDPATHLPLDDPSYIVDLMDALREAGAHEQLTVLAGRLPAAGQFDMFLGIGDHRERFKFGREPDGNAARAWSWEDLE